MGTLAKQPPCFLRDGEENGTGKNCWGTKIWFKMRPSVAYHHSCLFMFLFALYLHLNAIKAPMGGKALFVCIDSIGNFLGWPIYPQSLGSHGYWTIYLRIMGLVLPRKLTLYIIPPSRKNWWLEDEPFFARHANIANCPGCEFLGMFKRGSAYQPGTIRRYT